MVLSNEFNPDCNCCPGGSGASDIVPCVNCADFDIELTISGVGNAIACADCATLLNGTHTLTYNSCAAGTLSECGTPAPGGTDSCLYRKVVSNSGFGCTPPCGDYAIYLTIYPSDYTSHIAIEFFNCFSTSGSYKTTQTFYETSPGNRTFALCCVGPHAKGTPQCASTTACNNTLSCTTNCCFCDFTGATVTYAEVPS